MNGDERPLSVVEIFGPTLQGEGRLAGCRTMFVRLAGCDWACTWCDSAFTWRPGELAPVERLRSAEVIGRLMAMDPHCERVTISGGNPALQDAGPLIRAAHHQGLWLHVETQGSRAPAWLGEVDAVTVSPKGPSSSMPADWEALGRTLQVAHDPDLKVVVFTTEDLEYARQVHRRHPLVPLTLQVGTRAGQDDAASVLERTRWLAALALADPELGGVRVLPQLHVLLWGHRRGV